MSGKPLEAPGGRHKKSMGDPPTGPAAPTPAIATRRTTVVSIRTLVPTRLAGPTGVGNVREGDGVLPGLQPIAPLPVAVLPQVCRRGSDPNPDSVTGLL